MEEFVSSSERLDEVLNNNEIKSVDSKLNKKQDSNQLIEDMLAQLEKVFEEI